MDPGIYNLQSTWCIRSIYFHWPTNLGAGAHLVSRPTFSFLSTLEWNHQKLPSARDQTAAEPLSLSTISSTTSVAGGILGKDVNSWHWHWSFDQTKRYRTRAMGLWRLSKFQTLGRKSKGRNLSMSCHPSRSQHLPWAKHRRGTSVGPANSVLVHLHPFLKQGTHVNHMLVC